MKSAPVKRRKFLLYSAGVVAGMGLSPTRARASVVLREGIYCDRFTYRAGVDPIQVHLSLLDATSVDVTLVQNDDLSMPARVVGVYTVAADDTEMPFPLQLSLDTTGLEPGLYQISIDPLVMRPENRENEPDSWTSHNYICRFVVTAPFPGSVSNLLWIQDSLTPTAYGSFGGVSIYGGLETSTVRTVSYRRPGLDNPNDGNVGPMRRLKSLGYVFEFSDAVAFSLAPESIVDPYDLIVVQGQFEYLPHSFLSHLKRHIANGGRLLLAANEFAIFRVRLDDIAGTMTTYKFDGADDPVSGQDRAGVGMHNPDTIWETELAGLALWPARYLGGAPKKDMTVCNPSATGWLLEGTGFTEVIPQFASTWSSGNRGVLTGDSFNFLDPEGSRTPSDTIVWAATPSTDGRMWDQALPGQRSWQWSLDPDGHALCTWRELANGARVIGMAGHQYLQHFYNSAGYSRLFDNIFAYLTADPVAVPALGPVGLSALSASIAAEAGRRLFSKS